MNVKKLQVKIMQILVFIDREAFYDCLSYISTPDVSQS